MLRKNYWHFILISMLIALISGIGYASFISNKIYEESSTHLREIYAEVQKEFASLTKTNWNMLMDWDEYLSYGLDDLDETDLDKYFQSDKDRWGYSEVYFLNEQSDYVTLDRKYGHLDCGSQIRPLLQEKQNVVMDTVQRGENHLTIFAIPAQKNFYYGFPYTAVAVSYDNASLAKALNITAFSGKSRCYMLDGTGHIMLSTASDKVPSTNFLSYLDHHTSLSAGETDSFAKDLKAKKDGVIKYRANGIPYYLIYQPTGFQDWMIVGTVPKKAVNTNIPQVQIVTIAVLSILFLIAAVIGVQYLIRRYRSTLEAKNEELQYQEELSTILVKNTHDILILYSPEKKSPEYVSPNIQNLLGIDPALIDNDLSRLKECSIITRNSFLTADLSEAVGAGILQVESEWIHKETEEHRWYHETLYPVTLRGYQKLLLVISDRSGEYQNNMQLELALNIAKSANEAKSCFLSNMSHDLRTPLNAITGFSSLLREDANDPVLVRDYASKITTASHHLLGIINNVLDMSKIESGKTVLNIQMFDLQELLDKLNIMTLPLANAKGQTFTILQHNVFCKKLWGDSVRISQVLLNLLSNAVKYTPEGGNICLSVSMNQPFPHSRIHVIFSVEDDGIGIEEEFLRTIFEPFTRETDRIQENIQGTGLGMAITKNLIDLMGGHISIKTTPDMGSTFSIELNLRDTKWALTGSSALGSEGNADLEIPPDALPIVAVSGYPEDDEPLPADVPVKPSAVRYTPLAGLHILVADDNSFNADIMKDLLDLKGATCEIASTGQEAVDLFTSSACGHFDAILMDIRMPDMDGYEATKRIRHSKHPDHASIMIIATTANAFADDVKTTLASGMNAHLSKPVDLDTLCALLQSMQL